ncbi:MAG: hypothetical protein JW726_05390 [Anaerolineales bacterium]|nr:hypothetical protein [Anaerolineales bacterium]
MNTADAAPGFDLLTQRLARWTRWLRFRRAFNWAGYGLVFGLAFGLGLGLVALLAARLLRPEFILASVGTGLLSLAVAALVGYLWPLSQQQAAVHLDRALGLKERVSTALELAQEGAARVPEEMIRHQLVDTLSASHPVDIHNRLPLRIQRTQALVAALLLAVVVLVSLCGDQLFQATLHRRNLQQSIAEQIAQIETLQNAIENNPTLTPEQRQELLQPLEEAIQGLQEAETTEQAISVLTAAEEELQALDDPQASEQAEALQQAGSSLAQQEGSPLQSFGEQLAEGDILNAAQELSQVDPSELSPEEAAKMAEQLQEAAEALQNSNPQLAEHLQEAAQALNDGDPQAAQQALQQAGQSLSQAGQQIAQSQAAGQAASQLQQGQQQIIQAGGSGQQAQNGQGQGQGAGEGQGQGQGQGQGEGSSSQQGQEGAGGGSGKGTGDSGDVQGQEAGSDPIAQNNGPGDGGEAPYEPIYAPQRLGGEGGEDVTLPSSGEPGELVLGEGDTTPGEPSQSTVPYVDVYAYYAEFYRQAIENGQVPISMREFVRRYFSSLEP